jgi:acyl carrier protein
MRAGEKNVIDKLLHTVGAVKSVEQFIDIKSFSTADLVIDLGFDSLDLINLFFQIEEVFDVTISEEEIESCGLSKIENLVSIIDGKLGRETVR